MRFLDELGDAIEVAAERERVRLVRRRRTVQVVGVASIAAAGVGLVSLTGSGGSAVVDRPDLLPPPGATAPPTSASIVTTVPTPGDTPTTEAASESSATPDGDDIPLATTEDGDAAAPATSAPLLAGTLPTTSTAPPPEAAPPSTAAPTTTSPTTSATTSSTVATTAPTSTSPAAAPPPDPCATTGALLTATIEQFEADSTTPVTWVPGLVVTGTNADGTPGSLSTRSNAIAVADGRYAFQLDYLPPESPGGDGSAESLTLAFATPVCEIELGVRMLEAAEYEGLDESFAVIAFDDADAVIERRVFSAGEASDDRGIRTFQLAFGRPTTRIVLEPVAYGGGVATDVGPNNSDFGLVSVSAVAAP